MYIVALNRSVAFGNGTRKIGFEFAKIDCDDLNKFFESVSGIRIFTEKNCQELKIELQETVTREEFSRAMMNFGVLDFINPDEPDEEEQDSVVPEDVLEKLEQIEVANVDFTDSIKEKLAAKEVTNMKQVILQGETEEGFKDFGFTANQIDKLVEVVGEIAGEMGYAP